LHSFMILSKSCEYGVKAMIALITMEREVSRSSLKEIAMAIDSPEAFTSKIMQKLVLQGLVQSVKGKGGGFFIDAKVVKEVSIWDVVLAVDGTDIQDKCFLGLENCSSINPCAAHNKYVQVRTTMMQFLKNNKLKVLAEEVIDGQGILKL
jgi:Rrf2 family iron-sulfur cluster assembly transcriptional regulator